MQGIRAATTGEPNLPRPGLSPRMILLADAAWDIIAGAALIAASIAYQVQDSGPH